MNSVVDSNRDQRNCFSINRGVQHQRIHARRATAQIKASDCRIPDRGLPGAQGWHWPNFRPPRKSHVCLVQGEQKSLLALNCRILVRPAGRTKKKPPRRTAETPHCAGQGGEVTISIRFSEWGASRCWACYTSTHRLEHAKPTRRLFQVNSILRRRSIKAQVHFKHKNRLRPP